MVTNRNQGATIRNLKIHLDSDCLEQIEAITGSTKHINEALGYLGIWNLNYPEVYIGQEGHGPNSADLMAVYRDKTGHKKYVIGAVWHGDHYRFHS